ncbi:MAG: molybdenum cofactor biosynthesis protein MoaE [Gemmatimonadota bacterium]
MNHLTHEPIEAAWLARQVAGAESGGITTFTGVVRNHQDGRSVTRLEYSAFEPMADAECARIVSEAESRWPVAVRLRHRLGQLAIGDVAVAIAVAGAHRGEAFDACRYVIEEVKQRVPIWKKEFYADNTVAWVDPTKRKHDVDAAALTERPPVVSAP